MALPALGWWCRQIGSSDGFSTPKAQHLKVVLQVRCAEGEVRGAGRGEHPMFPVCRTKPALYQTCTDRAAVGDPRCESVGKCRQLGGVTAPTTPRCRVL